MKLTKYKNNITIAKYKNARVLVGRLSDDFIDIQFKILESNKEKANTPHSSHLCLNDKITVTGLKLSTIGAYALYKALESQLKLSDTIEK